MEEKLYHHEVSQPLAQVSERLWNLHLWRYSQLNRTKPWAASSNWTCFKQGTGSSNFRSPFQAKFKEWSLPLISRCDQVYNSMWQALEAGICKSFWLPPNLSSSITAHIFPDVKGERTNQLFEHLDVSLLILLKHLIILAPTKKENIFFNIFVYSLFPQPWKRAQSPLRGSS